MIAEAAAAGYETVDGCLHCGSIRSRALFDLEWKEICRQRFCGLEPYRHEAGHLFIRRCLDCGLEYQNPRPTEDKLLALAAQTYEIRPLNGIRRELFEDDLKLIRRHLSPGSSLLDVGCNTGAFLDLARSTYDVSGCDPCAQALEYGRNKLGLTRLYPGTIADMPLERFDAIVGLDVWEHLHSPQRFLEEATKRLRPGGILYVRTIRRDGLNARLAGRYWYGYEIWHMSFPTISHAVGMCGRFGFRPLETRITRSGWPYLKGSLKYHAKRAMGTALPFLPGLRRFNREVKRWKRHFSFYRDEFAAVFSYTPRGGQDPACAGVPSSGGETP